MSDKSEATTCSACGNKSMVGDFCIVCGPYYCEVCEFTGTAAEYEDHLEEFAHMVQDGLA